MKKEYGVIWDESYSGEDVILYMDTHYDDAYTDTHYDHAYVYYSFGRICITGASLRCV